MAATTTTLAVAMRVSDLTAVLASATGAVTGNMILIGGEYMIQTGPAVGEIIPVARGKNGSAQIAHAVSTSVRMGIASDFNVPDPIQAGVFTDASLTGDGSSARPLSSVGDGTGDVVGPASVTSGKVAVFSGTTGKLIAANSTGATAGPFTTIASIQVVNGLVTVLTGS